MDEHSVKITKYNFFEAMDLDLKILLIFKGRSSRSVFWYFWAGIYAISFCAGSIAELLGQEWMLVMSYILILPSISTHTRRLHDVNKSGWNYLWHFTGIEISYVIYLLIQPSGATNKYGEHPILPGDWYTYFLLIILCSQYRFV